MAVALSEYAKTDYFSGYMEKLCPWFQGMNTEQSRTQKNWHSLVNKTFYTPAGHVLMEQCEKYGQKFEFLTLKKELTLSIEYEDVIVITLCHRHLCIVLQRS